MENELEDLDGFYLAEATMELVRKGKEALYSSFEVREELGMNH